MGSERRRSRDAAAILRCAVAVYLSPASGSIVSLAPDNATLSGMETKRKKPERCYPAVLCRPARSPSERGRRAVGRTVVQAFAEGGRRYHTWIRVLKRCPSFLPPPELIG